jgi:hypothetical protein
MSLFQRSCRVCDEGLAPTVNQMLQQRPRPRLRDIAEKTGIPKSVIHRHSQKHFNQDSPGGFKSAYFCRGDRCLIIWRDQPSQEAIDLIDAYDAKDKADGFRTWFVICEYEPAITIKPTEPPKAIIEELLPEKSAVPPSE